MSVQPSYIPSPYYHVPLENNVRQSANWPRISHDIPFSDGISGRLTLRITAKTPIFVRAAGETEEGSFYRIGARFAIPGTSIKGSIRNVLKIWTAGRIGPLEPTAPHVKQPKKNRPNPDTYLDPRHLLPGDWSDTIFGTVVKEGPKSGNFQSLRGRVTFGPAFAPEGVQSLPQVRTVLAGPKEMYGPNYWSFDSNGKRTSIRGWKRYAVRPDGFAPLPPPPPNEKMAVCFSPLPANTVFEGPICFHNLQPAEFGAVLWTLLWGGAPNNSLMPHPDRRHQIGMAKPYGYGSCTIEIVGAEFPTWVCPSAGESEASDRLMLSIDAFKSSLPKGWVEADSIQELCALADSTKQPPDQAELRYPELKRFKEFKKDVMTLRRFTEVLKGHVEEEEQVVQQFGKPTSEKAKGPQCLDDLNVGDVIPGKINIPRKIKDEGGVPSYVFINFGFTGARQGGYLRSNEVPIGPDKNLASQLVRGRKVTVKIIKKTNKSNGTQVTCTMKGVPQDS